MVLFLKPTSWWGVWENVQCFFIGFILAPCYFIFHLTIVREGLVQLYNPGPLKFWTHIFLSNFCFVNVTGNMFMAIFTDTTLNKYWRSRKVIKNGSYCDLCKAYRPPKSWHCRQCNVCIVKRYQHCMFIARCVGHENQRYYLLFMMHLLISLMYSTFYDFFFILSRFETWEGFLLAVFQFTNPVLRIAMGRAAFDITDFYGCFLLMNILLIIWLFAAVSYHWENAFAGVTPHDRKCKNKTSKCSMESVAIQEKNERNACKANWRQNMLRIFGEKWYWAVLIPFVDSPIPDYDNDGDFIKIT